MKRDNRFEKDMDLAFQYAHRKMSKWKFRPNGPHINHIKSLFRIMDIKFNLNRPALEQVLATAMAFEGQDITGVSAMAHGGHMFLKYMDAMNQYRLENPEDK